MRASYILIIISGIFYGVIAPGAQLFIDRNFTALDVSLYRAMIVALLLIPTFLINSNYLISKKALPFYAVYGLIGALLEISMFYSLALGVPIALVAFFLYSQPVWTIIFGKFLLKEKITKYKIVAVILGLLGISVLFRSWQIESTKSILGISLALLSGILLSLWVIWGRKSTLNKQHPVTITFGLALFSTTWILIFYFLIKNSLLASNGSLQISTDLIRIYWKEFILFALISGVLPHIMFYKGLEKVRASIAGIILLTEPLSATIIAAIVFNQKIGFELLIGGILIFLSNYFVLKNDLEATQLS